ncbi:MAG: M28 family peptidase, partial [Saprospiraceae bacterium]|nr:M28 family peptidase [Saprospiraceae bacterium]
MRKYTIGLLLMLGFQQISLAQTEDTDAFFIKSLYDEALSNPVGYHWLGHLCEGIGGRLAGSPGAAAAVDYTAQVMDTIGLDTVYMQACDVPHWERGDTEIVRIVNSSSQGTVDLGGLALGNSFGTGPAGLTAEVVEVKTLDEVEELGAQNLAGKIVFFNRPMDPTQLRTFNAYGGAVDQRVWGASKAAAAGAVAVLVRSMTTRLDDEPHTGTLVYNEDHPKIPAIAISTKDANLLSQLLNQENVEIFMRNTSRMLQPKRSYNVVGEIRGSTHPDEIIAVGGHLDSWDVGQGAHDDGSGCVHS